MRLLILALDTTSRAGSLAVLRGTDVLAEMSGDATVTHGQRLPLDFVRVCERAGIGLADVGLFAVAAGPGSFTGLRVGIAAIQGLAMAYTRRVVPVSTLEAVAAGAPPDAEYVGAWVDAQRGEVFAQVFRRPAPLREGDRPLAGDTLPMSAAPEAVLASWREHVSLESISFQGDGAIRYGSRIRAVVGSHARIAETAPVLAVAIGRIAAASPDRAVLPHAIVPVYVRRPDAELARARREGVS